MVYLSNQILFVILVAVLIVGGSSKLIVEGLHTDKSGTGCLSGCTRAAAPSGNCKWLPENLPRSQQRYICPHTCRKENAETGKTACTYDSECSKCASPTDFTAFTYSKAQVTKGTGTACAISKPCRYNARATVLNICNPYDAPNNGENNLICANKSSTNDPSEAKWVDINTAVGILPLYTSTTTSPTSSSSSSSTTLQACDVNKACSTEGATCTDATGNRIICRNNLWLNDPKYSSSRHDSYSSGRYGGRYGGRDDDDDDDDTNTMMTDNYYTVNHFYGPQAAPAPATARAATAAPAPAAAPAAVAAVAPAPAILSTPPPSNNYGVTAGSTTVPLIVPKGEVAIVRPYESSIRL